MSRVCSTCPWGLVLSDAQVLQVVHGGLALQTVTGANNQQVLHSPPRGQFTGMLHTP